MPSAIPGTREAVIRILISHSRYRSGPTSGENQVVADELELLRDAGHDVFSLVLDSASVGGGLRAGASAVWSSKALRLLRTELRRSRPDVIHFHNFFPALSPAVARLGREEGLPVVVTLHNYRLMCLPATFLRDGKPCELCLGKVPWRGVVHRCYRDSLPASGSLATSLTMHRALGTFDGVTLYLAVSEFVRRKHISAGFPATKVIVKENFAWSSPPRQEPGDYFLYAGRVAPEKDLVTLMAAFKGLDAELVIMGDGPDMDSVRNVAPRNVRFRGTVTQEEVRAALLKCIAVLLPSLSYEGAPRGIVEAFAASVPVIASELGAIPEFIEDGISGILVPTRDVVGWREALGGLLQDGVSSRLGNGANEVWRKRFTPERALKELEAAYTLAINRSQ